MKYKVIITAIALAIVTGLTVQAEDQPATPPKHEGHGGHHMGLLPPPIVEKLSADQKTKYDAIVADFKNDMKNAGDDKEKKMSIMKEARKKAIDILTDDQKAELKKMREQHGSGKRPEGAPKQ